MLYFIIWSLASLGLAYFLFKKTRIFRKKLGIVIAFSVALAAAIIHNLFLYLLKISEPVFSSIAFLALGLGIIILSVWLAGLLGNIINQERKNRI